MSSDCSVIGVPCYQAFSISSHLIGGCAEAFPSSLERTWALSFTMGCSAGVDVSCDNAIISNTNLLFPTTSDSLCPQKFAKQNLVGLLLSFQEPEHQILMTNFVNGATANMLLSISALLPMQDAQVVSLKIANGGPNDAQLEIYSKNESGSYYHGYDDSASVAVNNSNGPQFFNNSNKEWSTDLAIRWLEMVTYDIPELGKPVSVTVRA